MDKAVTVCAPRTSCTSAVLPSLADAFPPSAHLPWRPPWASRTSPSQLRRQRLFLTAPCSGFCRN